MAPFAVTVEFTERSSTRIRDISFVTSAVELDVNEYDRRISPNDDHSEHRGTECRSKRSRRMSGGGSKKDHRSQKGRNKISPGP